MMAALILVVSVAAFLQFFFFYCRSLVAACRKYELSEEARDVIGMRGTLMAGDDFDRVLVLVGLCPEPGNDGGRIRAVKSYYRLLGVLRWLVPGAATWAERERAGCTYFAAVALDRRIAHNRELMAQQSTARL